MGDLGMTDFGSPYVLFYKKDKGNYHNAAVAPIIAGAKGPQNGGAYPIGGWETDWTQIATFEFGGNPYVLFYKGNVGNYHNAAVAPIVAGPNGPQNGGAYPIGGWETDWTQIATFEFGGKPYLLFYKGNVGNYHDAAVAPIIAGPNGPQNGAAYPIGGWETDWTQIATFEFEGKPYVLFYKGNVGNYHNAAVAPIVAGPNGPQNGAAYPIGGWETDWTQITTFEFGGNTYLLFYKANGLAAVAPIVAGPNGPQNGAAYPIGGWENDWTDVECFEIAPPATGTGSGTGTGTGRGTGTGPGTGTGEPGTGEPGTGEPGTGEPGTGDPGTNIPVTGDPTYSGTEDTDSGTDDNGTDDGNFARKRGTGRGAGRRPS